MCHIKKYLLTSLVTQQKYTNFSFEIFFVIKKLIKLPAHIVNRPFNRNNSLQIERVDIVNAGNGDFRICFLHYSFDSVATFTDNSSN